MFNNFKLIKNIVMRLLMVSLCSSVLLETELTAARNNAKFSSKKSVKNKNLGTIGAGVAPAIGTSCTSTADCSASNLVCDFASSTAATGTCQLCIAGSNKNLKGGDFGCTSDTATLTNTCCGAWGCENGTCGPLLQEEINIDIITVSGVACIYLAALGLRKWLFMVVEDSSSGETSLVATGLTDEAVSGAGAAAVVEELGFGSLSNAPEIIAATTAGVAASIVNPSRETAYVPVPEAGRPAEPGYPPTSLAARLAALEASYPAPQPIPTPQPPAIVAAEKGYIASDLGPKAKAALSRFRNIVSVKDALTKDTSGAFAKLLLAQNICTESDADNFLAAISAASANNEFGEPTFTDAAKNSAKVAQPGALLKALLESAFIQNIKAGTGVLVPTRIKNNLKIAQDYATDSNVKALKLIENLGNFSFNSINLYTPSETEKNSIATGVARVQQMFVNSGFDIDDYGFPSDSSLTFFGE